MKVLVPILLTSFLFACSSDDLYGDDEEYDNNDQQYNSEQQSSNDQQANNSSDVTYQCGNADHPSVGHMAILSTLHHDVAGQVLIKDNCTLEVTSFTYDGEGPSVYFYLGLDSNFKDGFAVGEQLNGTVFDNDSFEVKLQSTDALDKMNSISVWCYDFDVSFGDGVFQ